MNMIFLLCVLVVSTALASLHAHAIPISVPAGDVLVTYDSDTFAFSTADDGHNQYGSIQHIPIPISDVTIRSITNGMEIDFNDHMRADDISHGIFDDYQPGTGSFMAGFDFSPWSGFRISGYTITLIGSGSVSTFGPANARLFVDGLGDLSYGGGSFFFNEILYSNGSMAPLLMGGIHAQSEPSAYEVVVGYQDVLVGYDYYYPDPDCTFDGCPRDEFPIYESQPIIELLDNGGNAAIQLDMIRITANLIAVPAPASWLLLVVGLSCMSHLLGRHHGRFAA